MRQQTSHEKRTSAGVGNRTDIPGRFYVCGIHKVPKQSTRALIEMIGENHCQRIEFILKEVVQVADIVSFHQYIGRLHDNYRCRIIDGADTAALVRLFALYYCTNLWINLRHSYFVGTCKVIGRRQRPAGSKS